MLTKIVNTRFGFPVAVFVFFMICYQAAFKKTIAAWRLNRQFLNEIQDGANMSEQPAYLLRKQKNLEILVRRYTADSTNFRTSVIGAIAQLSDSCGVKITTVPAEQAGFQTAQTAVETITFTGDYFHLLRMLQAMEQAAGIGTVRSVNLHLPQKAVPATGAALEMDVYLQVIKS